MDAIQMLKQEHEQAKKMFADIEQASAEARGQLWMKLKPELKVHEQLEETALYAPVAKEVGSKDADDSGDRRVGGFRSAVDGEGKRPPADSRAPHRGGRRRHWDTSKLVQGGEQMATMKRQKMQQAA